MSGIMAAVAGGAQNVIYAAGLYNSTLASVNTGPIYFSSGSSGGASLSFDYTWIGYYRPANTGTVTFSITTSWIQYISFFGTTAYNWGGGVYSLGYLWLGNTARSGYLPGNANIASNNNTVTYSPSLTAGIYYPIRLQMQMYLPYSSTAYLSFYPGWSDGAFSFSAPTTDLTNLIWYNTKGPGF